MRAPLATMRLTTTPSKPAVSVSSADPPPARFKASSVAYASVTAFSACATWSRVTRCSDSVFAIRVRLPCAIALYSAQPAASAAHAAAKPMRTKAGLASREQGWPNRMLTGTAELANGTGQPSERTIIAGVPVPHEPSGPAVPARRAESGHAFDRGGNLANSEELLRSFEGPFSLPRKRSGSTRSMAKQLPIELLHLPVKQPLLRRSARTALNGAAQGCRPPSPASRSPARSTRPSAPAHGS